MTNEEMNVLRTLFRDEANATEQRLRGAIREEVNAAVYASEQRMREYVHEEINTSERRMHDYVDNAIAPIQGAIAPMQAAITSIQGAIAPMQAAITSIQGAIAPMQGAIVSMQGAIASLNDRVGLLAIAQREMQGDLLRLRIDVEQVISVLDDATFKINELQVSQRASEIKLDENIANLKREMEKFSNNLATFAKQLINLNVKIHERLEMHERTQVDQAHPRIYPHTA